MAMERRWVERHRVSPHRDCPPTPYRVEAPDREKLHHSGATWDPRSRRPFQNPSRNKGWTSKYRLYHPPLGQPGGKDDPLRRGYSGAGVRKYLKYSTQGLTSEDAREKALERKCQTDQGNKTFNSLTSCKNSMDKNKYLDLQDNLSWDVTKTQAGKQLEINPRQDDRRKQADDELNHVQTYPQWEFTHKDRNQLCGTSSEPRIKGLPFPILQQNKTWKRGTIYRPLGEPAGLRFLMQGLTPEKAREKALERRSQTTQAKIFHFPGSHDNSVDKNKSLDWQDNPLWDRNQCETQAGQLLERNIQRIGDREFDCTPTQANLQREYRYERIVKYSGSMSELRDSRVFQNPSTGLFHSSPGQHSGKADSLKSGLCGTGETEPFNSPSYEYFLDNNKYPDWQVQWAKNMNITRNAGQLKMNLGDCIGNPDKKWQPPNKMRNWTSIQANPQCGFLQRERINHYGATTDSRNKEQLEGPSKNEEWTLNHPLLRQLESKDDPLRIGLNPTESRIKALERKLQNKEQQVLENIGEEREKKIALFQNVTQFRTSESGNFLEGTEVCSEQATVKVNIVHKDHPGKQLSADELEVLKAAIIREMSRGSSCKLKIASIHIRSGFVVVDCIGQETADWIRSAVPLRKWLRKWKGPEIVTWPGDNITNIPDLRLIAIIIFFPHSANYSDNFILSLVDTQNEGLATKQWKFINSKREGNGKFLTIGVDKKSFEELKKNKFMVNFTFGQVHVRVMGDLSREPEEKERKETFPGSEGRLEFKATTSQDTANLAEEVTMISAAAGWQWMW